MNPVRVAIVEDEEIIRKSLNNFLQKDPGINVVGLYSKAEDFILNFEKLNAEVILMDINLPGKSGITCVAEMKPLRPSVQYMMCTSYDNPEKIFESLKVGATGYIMKNAAPQKIIEAIHDINNGGSPMSPQIARLVVSGFSEKQKNLELLKTFSPREQEILQALAKGYQYREIAEQLFISIETVRTYLRRIYEKLQVHSKVEALNKVFPK